MSVSEDDRARALERIQRTYRRYLRHGRSRLWDTTNPGYARMLRDRDHALVELIWRSYHSGDLVLDLGCGPGDFADVVRSELPDVNWTGVDLLPEAIAVAQRSRPWATWFEGSADRLPFPDGTFAVIVASTLFSSLPSRGLESAVAHEIQRVMHPGGWLVWYDIRYDSPRNPNVHGLGRAALAELFPDWSTDLSLMTLLPPLARRLGALTRLAYAPLELVPALRSHFIGRLQRPAATRSTTLPDPSASLRRSW